MKVTSMTAGSQPEAVSGGLSEATVIDSSTAVAAFVDGLAALLAQVPTAAAAPAETPPDWMSMARREGALASDAMEETADATAVALPSAFREDAADMGATAPAAAGPAAPPPHVTAARGKRSAAGAVPLMQAALRDRGGLLVAPHSAAQPTAVAVTTGKGLAVAALPSASDHAAALPSASDRSATLSLASHAVARQTAAVPDPLFQTPHSRMHAAGVAGAQSARTPPPARRPKPKAPAAPLSAMSGTAAPAEAAPPAPAITPATAPGLPLPPATAPLPLSPPVAEQHAQQLLTLQQSALTNAAAPFPGTQTTAVAVMHPTFGRVQLQLAQHAHNLQVVAQVADFHAATALRAGKTQLQNRLAQHGMALQTLRVSLRRPHEEEEQ